MPQYSSNTGKISPPEPSKIAADPWSRKKFRALLSMFGPAAIVASVAIGAGETIMVVRAGAWAGYGLLWLVLLSVLVKGVFATYLLGRYTAVSGELLGERLVKLPGPRGWLLILLLVLELAAAGPLWAAISRPCGELVHYLFVSWGQAHALDPRVFSTFFVVLALGLSLLITYDRLERQQLIICSILVLGTVGGTLMVHPDIGATLRGLFSVGRMPELLGAPAEVRANPLPLLAVTFGYVGGSVMTYLVYTDWIALHGWGLTGHAQIDEIRYRAAHGKPGDYLPEDQGAITEVRRSLMPLRWDVGCGAVVLLAVSASFMLAGAAVMHPKIASGELSGVFNQWSLLTDQAMVWESIHPALVWVYYVCILVALWGTLQAYPDIYARGIVSFGRAIAPRRNWRPRAVQLWTCGYVLLATLAVLWSDWDFHLLTLIVAFLATNLGVTLAMVAALYLNFQLPSPYRTRWWMLTGGVLSAILLLAVSVISGRALWSQLQQALSAGVSAV
ncbi:MAG: Nramp family divalent metal transporter [Pirellulales bacterium]|nr:Nramp family divalent metal transporter [Pirellulales bacterium]